MEELKQLIREDKELIGKLDEHLVAFKDGLIRLDEVVSLFTAFFERQDRFMVLMQEIMEKQK